MLPRFARSASTRRAISAAISGVSGAPAQSTNCAAGSKSQRGVEQVGHALLARDAAHEDDRRALRVDAVALSTSVPRSGRYSSASMPLWMTLDARRVDARDSTARMSRALLARHGDDRVGGLERRSARRSWRARSRRRAAPPSTAAAARGCAPSRRAGCRTAASPGGRRSWRTRCGCARRPRPRPPRPSRGRSRPPAAPRRCGAGARQGVPRPVRDGRRQPVGGLALVAPAVHGDVDEAASSRARYSTCTPAPP